MRATSFILDVLMKFNQEGRHCCQRGGGWRWDHTASIRGRHVSICCLSPGPSFQVLPGRQLPPSPPLPGPLVYLHTYFSYICIYYLIYFYIDTLHVMLCCKRFPGRLFYLPFGLRGVERIPLFSQSLWSCNILQLFLSS